MSEEQDEAVAVREVPADAPDEDDLELVDEDDETLDEDASDMEAGMSDGGIELPPTEVTFETDESGVAR